MIIGRLLNKIINVFTGLFGIATIILMLIISIYNFMPSFIASQDAIRNIILARDICTLATVFCAGTEFTLRRNVILAVIFAVIIIAVAAFVLYTNLNINILTAIK